MPLTASVRVLRRQFGLGELGVEDRLTAAWRAEVGDALADLTSFVEIRRGRLFIGVNDPSMVEPLRWKAEASHDALRSASGESAWEAIVVRYVRSGESA
jgi:hypothetical protein